MVGRFQKEFVLFGVALLVITALSTKAYSQFDDCPSAELWQGSFKQLKPIKWEGPLRMFLCFDEEKTGRQDLFVVLTWPTLGGEMTGGKGSYREGEIFFSENRCLSKGGCLKTVLGGNFKAKRTRDSDSLQGTAENEAYGLKGSYNLKRVK